jgi:preprotein translocase subunit SecG
MLPLVLTIVQVVSSLAIVGLVLMQRGKGAEAGAGFGAGASGTVFGARGARTVLSRATAIFAAIFMINSLALAYMGSRTDSTVPKTVLDEAGETVSETVTPPAKTESAPQIVPLPAPVPAPAPGEAAP